MKNREICLVDQFDYINDPNSIKPDELNFLFLAKRKIIDLQIKEENSTYSNLLKLNLKLEFMKQFFQFISKLNQSLLHFLKIKIFTFIF